MSIEYPGSGRNLPTGVPARPLPAAIDWQPEMGHVSGAGYEWRYAAMQPLGQTPDWSRQPAYPLPPLATRTPAAPSGTGATRPGFPVSISPQSLLGQENQPGFWETGPGGVFMGAAPGEQYGGAIRPWDLPFVGRVPIATAPVTIANWPVYTREGAIALIDSILTGGSYIQGPDGTIPALQHEPGWIDHFVNGLRTVGDAINVPIEAVGNTVRQASASGRIMAVAQLYEEGHVDAALIDGLTSLFGAERKFDLAQIAAANPGKVDEAVAKLYDLPMEVTQRIKGDPGKYRSPLGRTMLAGPGTAAWDEAAGIAYSTDAFTNMALEAAAFGGELVAGVGLLKVGARAAGLGVRAIAGPGAGQGVRAGLTRGLTGVSRAEAARLPYFVGRGTRIAAQGAAINNAAGLTIRGLEWGVKEVAVLAGNKELADTMDRLMWNMPLALNPGLNLMTAFTSHPIDTGKQLLRGRLPIGRPGTPGEVGVLRPGRLSIVEAADPDVVVTLAGRPLTLVPSVHEALGTIRQLDLDGMHAYVFRGTGWDLGTMRNYLRNDFDINENTLRDGIFYTYLQAARETAGDLARLVPGATMAEVSENFVTRYMPRVLEMLKSDLDGRTTFFADTVKGQFWDFASREDTAMGRLKAPLGAYHPAVSLAAYMSWLRASKVVREAVTERASRFRLQPRHRTDIDADAIGWWRRDVLGKYDADDVVALSDIDRLKEAAGLIERRGRGHELIRRAKEPRLTRADMEAILDDVVAVWEKEGDRPPRPPGLLSRDETDAVVEGGKARAAEAAERAGPAEHAEGIPYGPPTEGAAARVMGVSLPTVRFVREVASKADDAKLRTLEPPADLLGWFARYKPLDLEALPARLAGDRAVFWREMLDMWDERMSEITSLSATVGHLEDLARVAGQEAAAGAFNAADAAALDEAVAAITANLVNPVGDLEHYSLRLGRNGGLQRGRIVPTSERSVPVEGLVSHYEMEHPGVAVRMESAKAMAAALAARARELVSDPAMAQVRVAWRQVAFVDDAGSLVSRAFPTGMTEAGIFRLLALAKRAARSRNASPADTTMLRDPAIHPLEKRAAILRVLEDDLAPADRALVDSPVAMPELAGAESALKRFSAELEELTGLATQASRMLALEPFGGWSPLFTDQVESLRRLARGARIRNEGRLGARQVQLRRAEALAQHQQATGRLSVADQELARLQGARDVVGLRRGEWGEPRVVGQAQGRDAAEVALARFRAEDPGASFRYRGKGGGWYDIERAERAVAEGAATGAEGAIETALAEGRIGEAQAVNRAVEAMRGGWENPPAGRRITLEPEAPGVYGAATSFPDLRVTDVRKKVQARFRLVDVDEIRTSDQPGYPAELQPRDLDQARVHAIAERFDPDAALRTESGAHGTPVVTPDVVAVAGNHRVGGMRQLTPEQWTAYHDAIRARADEFGVPEPTGRQVLVREIAAEDATPDLALALNTETQAMSAGEMARAVARAITPEDLRALTAGGAVSIDTALTREGNAGFIGRLVGELPPNERARYLDPATGGATQPGIDLVRQALLMQTLPGQYDLVKGWIEQPATRTSIAAVIDGLEAALPQLAEANALVGFGQRPDVLGPTLGEAIRRLKTVREDRAVKRSERIEALRSGIDDIPQAGELAATLEQLSGAGEVTAFLRGAADRIIADVGSDPTALTMFELPAVPTESLRMYLDAGVDAVNVAREAKGAGGMFSAEVLDHFPDETGRAHYEYKGPAGESREMTEQPGTVEEVALREAVDASPADTRVAAEIAAAEELTARGAEQVGDDAARLYNQYEAAGRAGYGHAFYDTLVEDFNRQPNAAMLAVIRELSGVVRFDEAGLLVPAFQPGRVQGRWRRIDAAIREVSQPPDVPGTPLVVPAPRSVPGAPVRGLMGGGEMPNERAIRGAAGEGRHVITDDTRAARRVAGQAEKDAPARVSQFNEPDLAVKASRLDEAITRQRGEVEAARQRVAEAPAPTGAEPVFSDLDTARLYERYMFGRQSELPPAPETVWEVMDALESLDGRFPGFDPTMTAAEAERLRMSLHGFLDRYISRHGGAPSEPVPQAAGGGAAPPRRPRRAPPLDEDGPPTPDELHAEAQAVIASLRRVVLDDPDATPLAGFEGTQYEFGPLPGDPTLGPRLVLDSVDDYLEWADEVIPGLGEELLWGRKQKWADRMATGRLKRSLVETIPLARAVLGLGRAGRGAFDVVLGSRPERQIVRQAIDRFTDELLGPVEEGMQLGLWGDDIRVYEGAVKQVEGIIGAIHRFMETQRFGPLERFRVTQYRRVGLVPDKTIQKVATDYLREANDGNLPAWYERYLQRVGPGLEDPIAEAWRKADNRIRAWFARDPQGGVGRFVEGVYASSMARGLSGNARALTVFYHLLRFGADIRWLGLEAVEAGILAASREGPGVWLAAHNMVIRNGRVQRLKAPKGQLAEELRPLGFGEDVLARYRHDWAWWLQQAESGLAFGRLRYVLSIVRADQMARLPRELNKLAHTDPQIRDMLATFGSTPEEWVRALSETWDLSSDIARRRSSLGREQMLSPEEAQRYYQPFLDRGIIDAAEYADLVKAGRHTPTPEIDAELAKLTDPRMQPVLERLKALNEGFWNDAASLIYGQADRSNFQRFVNHPLLWWPTSYMLKATKWLTGILFERALGRDTGAGGAYTLAQLHQAHVEALQGDPEYRRQFAEHPTLTFVAQMFFPVTPWDMGVSLSPMTRGAMESAGIAISQETPEDPYRRNFFSWGPFYTFGSLLPRLIAEEFKAAEPGTVQETITRALEPRFPLTFTVKPSRSRLSQAESESAAGLPAYPSPDELPATRFAR